MGFLSNIFGKADPYSLTNLSVHDVYDKLMAYYDNDPYSGQGLLRVHMPYREYIRGSRRCSETVWNSSCESALCPGPLVVFS